jgi:ElaB/YqjD/DUF883 family membrane-anchored ribosome-binding protein
MRKLITCCLAVAFVATLCLTALAETAAPAQPDRPQRPTLTPEQREEAQTLMARLRELGQNEDIRAAAVKARENEAVQKANAKVQELQDQVRKAQEAANAVLTETMIKQNPELAKLIKERQEIQQKLQKLYGDRGFGGRMGGFGMGAPRGGTRGGDGTSPRRRPGAPTE